MSKFGNVPADEDTRILFQLEAMLGEYEILYQKWYWEGITAESIIFSSEDLSNLDDHAIEEEVRSSPLVNDGSSVTLKRCESGYVFVNFNFITD